MDHEQHICHLEMKGDKLDYFGEHPAEFQIKIQLRRSSYNRGALL